MIIPGTSPTDSAAIVDGFVQNWIRENLMIVEAEKNIAADINLNKLVDDYRSSLLVYNFEKRLVDKNLDTIISNAEQKVYYEENKNQYLLSHPIVRCIISKIPARQQEMRAIRTALNKSDLTEAMFLVKEKSVYHHIDLEKWMSFEDLRSLIPVDMVPQGSIKSGKVYEKNEGEFYFFVKIIGFYDEKQIPPFEYIKSKITKTILSQRKNNLLKQYRAKLYENGITNGDFEIFE
ncbi:MAG: hypothetical protein IPL55_23665 [Saprospiraceae bacterium]|nr:hypothetical protein [Saprospiraceae bacterium]MBL0025433.1 hypothetical protein [Saprospiraceae bacterium]